jgi:sterol 14alpha-demethylase
LIEEEVLQYIEKSKHFKGSSGTVNIPPAMAEITIFTAARTLQGEEVRAKLNSSFAKLYHDLDLGFSPINFMMPWAPLPRNRKRDAAQVKMREVYMNIIKARRQGASVETDDMLSNLMCCSYKNGTPIPDKEIAHMMITLLMAGQHSFSAISAWVMLRLAAHPEIMEELYQEQKRELGEDLPPLRFVHLQKLSLNQQVVKETLRLHNAIHSLMRKVKNPLPIKGTDWIIPTSHTLLASTGVTSQSSEYFKDPSRWDPHRWDNKVDMEDDETIDYGYGSVSKGTKSLYLPFGAGRHRCIGEQFAYLNLGVIVAVMVRELVFTNLHGEQGVVGTDYSVCLQPRLRSKQLPTLQH